VGDTDIVLPVPISMPPQEPVYQFMIVLLTEVDKTDVPSIRHIVFGVAVGTGGFDGKAVNVTIALD